MTVETEIRAKSYFGNGITTEWPFPWRWYDSEHIKVASFLVDGTRIERADFTILPGNGTPQDGYDGGVVVFAAQEGERFEIVREVPFLQEAVDLEYSSAFDPRAVERQLDLNVQMIQQVRDSDQWRGPWRPDAEYEISDVVRYLNDLYIARFNHTSQATFDRAQWELYLPQGPQGPRGPRGEVGEQGDQGIQGEKGDPGNYFGFELSGVVTSIDDLPGSADESDIWGVLTPGVLDLYVWASGAFVYAGPLTAAPAFPQHGTVFVAKNGSDENSGRSTTTPVETIAKALEIATASNQRPFKIQLGPGVYEIDGPLSLPDEVGLFGDMRMTEIRMAPGAEENNAVLVGSGCYVEGITFTNLRIDDLEDPSVGFAIAFRPGAVLNRLPYVHKIVAYRAMPPALVSAPLDRANGNPLVGNGAGVLLADGAVLSQYSPFAQAMAWGATPSTPNGIGYCAKNRAFINAVNAVTLWAHRHFMARSGGEILLSSCSSQFGDWSLSADGGANYVIPEEVTQLPVVNIPLADAIDADASDIIDDMWDALVANEGASVWPQEAEDATRFDATLFLRAISLALRGGSPRPIGDFTAGLFDYKGDPVFDSVTYLDGFVASFINMRDQINAKPEAGGVAGSVEFVTAMVAALNNTITTPEDYTAFTPSRVEAINHQWTFPLAGVTRSALPARHRGQGVARQIRQSLWRRNGGQIVFSGQDSKGNAVFAGEAVSYNARTGRLEGPGIERVIEERAIEAAIAGSF
jgi:hypothetical protein